MAQDAYGYETDAPPPPSPGAPGSSAIAGCSTVVWLGSAVLWCGGCSGLLAWQPPKTAESSVEFIGVWLLLVAPAWPLAAIALWTVALHGATRRWWVSAGPNVVVGGVTGCGAWLAVFLGWAVFAAVNKP